MVHIFGNTIVDVIVAPRTDVHKEIFCFDEKNNIILHLVMGNEEYKILQKALREAK